MYPLPLCLAHTDINECQGTALCPANSTCLNTFGSFVCVCNDGFVKKESVCIGKNASFLGLISTAYILTWQHQPHICTADVDECRFNESCPEHSTCMNSFGSFTCTCNDGYMRNGSVCIGKQSL